MKLVAALLLVAAAVSQGATADRVLVEQYGMVQCPMTSTWFNMFWKFCLTDGAGLRELVDFQEYFVGGKSGGPVTNATWNSSFHGYQEVIGDSYHLCARDQAPNASDISKNMTFLDFEACMNGDGVTGIAFIPKNAEKCAHAHGLDYPRLKACAEGASGNKMYHDSVWHTSDAGIKYDAPNLPVIHINGKEFKGLDAYVSLSKRICNAAGLQPGSTCGCSTHLTNEVALAAGRQAAAMAVSSR